MSLPYTQKALDYKRVEEVIRYIENNFRLQPELKDISDHIGLSEFHLQRLPIESLPPANLTGHEDVGQKVHLDPFGSVSLTSITSPTPHVE